MNEINTAQKEPYSKTIQRGSEQNTEIKSTSTNDVQKDSVSDKKVEGINQKIKTIRRNSYGLPDDEYFFLKLFDASRQKWRAQIE